MATATDTATSVLTSLLQKMGVEATVAVSQDEPPVLEISSEDAGTLIGHRGEGMKALQHLVRVMLMRRGDDTPVLIDIEGYRAKQQEQLQELASRKADEVVETGRLAVLQPMSSYERRLVHVALAERDDVLTESLGEGGNRRVMIKKVE